MRSIKKSLVVRAGVAALRRIVYGCARLSVVWALSAPAERVFPMPREIEAAGESIVLKPAEKFPGLLVTRLEEPSLRVGAEFIQARVAALGGAIWPAVAVASAPPDAVLRVWIVVAGADEKGDALIEDFGARVTPRDPGPQGYAIRYRKTGRTREVLVAGSDALGALYGCVTFAHFIETAADGSLGVAPHNVRDWPDFLYRCLAQGGEVRDAWQKYDSLVVARKPAEAEEAGRAFDEVMRTYLDWMLWNKINLFLPFVPSVRNTAQVNRMGRWTRVMEARGVSFNWCRSPAVGSAAQKRRGCVTLGASEYCWSDDETHRIAARKTAETVRDLRIKHFSLHSVDADGPDPEHWSRRCDECRKRFGDDRAAADLNVFRYYYEAIRELAPNCRIEFVPVPYKAWPFYRQGTMELSIEWLQGNPEAAEKQRMTQAALAYFGRLDELLPKDVCLTLREHGRGPAVMYKKAFGGRPLALWWWQFPARGWQTYFHSMGRYAKTWYSGDCRDLIFVTSNDLPVTEPLVTLFNNEYAWNVNAPGAAVMEEAYDYRTDRRLLEPAEVVDPFLEAACLRTYGSVAGPAVAEVCRQNISLPFVARPRVTRVINGEAHNLYSDDEARMVDLLPPMAAQAAAAERALAACATLLEGCPRLDPSVQTVVAALACGALAARYAAAGQAARWKAGRALLEGNFSEARRTAETALQTLAGRADTSERLAALLKGYPEGMPAPGTPEHDLGMFDFDVCEKDLTEMVRLAAVGQSGRVPVLRTEEGGNAADAPWPWLTLPLEPRGGLMAHTTTVAARLSETGLELTFALREDAPPGAAAPPCARDGLLLDNASAQRDYVGVYLRSAADDTVRAFLFDRQGNRLDARCPRGRIAKAALADWDPRWPYLAVRRPHFRQEMELAWQAEWTVRVEKAGRHWTAAVVLPWKALSENGTGLPGKMECLVERYWRSREPFSPGEYGRLGDLDGRWIPVQNTK
jgi:hypothetical protein